MEILPPIAAAALSATLLLLLTLIGMRMRMRQRQLGRRGVAREAIDTVAGWPPEATRVLTVCEREAYDLVRRAMPGYLVLAQVPISRFIRVPTRHSYGDWLQRVGSLSADLLLCDAGSRVLAVVDIRAAKESTRGRRRHERMARVLEAAGIAVHTWREGELPTLNEARSELAALATAAHGGTRRAAAPLAPAIPVPEMIEILAAGDLAALEGPGDAGMEPVPSAFFEDFETAPAPR